MSKFRLGADALGTLMPAIRTFSPDKRLSATSVWFKLFVSHIGSRKNIQPKKEEFVMSAEAAQSFVKKVESDEELQKQVSSAKSDKPEESLAKVVEIGSAAGFTFTSSELKDAASELSDKQLDEAAGGWSWSLLSSPTSTELGRNVDTLDSFLKV